MNTYRDQSPLLSVIVPVYNVEGYLSRCIDSILSQTFTNFELILIDDGSLDRCGEICDEYAKKNDRVVVIHQENKGVSAARNRGLEIAKGEYVTFCDSDDFVYKEWLQNFVSNISEVDLCVQNFDIVDCNSTIFPNKLLDKTYIGINGIRTFIITLIEKRCYGYIFTKIFKLDIIKKYNLLFDIRSTFREDEQFLSLYIEHIKSVRTTSAIGYRYYLPPASKKYRGDAYYSLIPILDSFNRIFGGNFPKVISDIHYSNVEAAIVCSMLNNEIPDRKLIYYLKKFMIDKTVSFKKRISTFFMIYSPYLKIISLVVIKFIHKISINREK